MQFLNSIIPHSTSQSGAAVVQEVERAPTVYMLEKAVSLQLSIWKINLINVTHFRSYKIIPDLMSSND